MELQARRSEVNISIKTKLTQRMLAGIVVPFIIVSAAVLAFTYQGYRSQVIDSQLEVLGKTANQISTFQSLVENLSNQIVSDDAIQGATEPIKKYNGTRIFKNIQSRRRLARYVYSLEGIQSAIVYIDNGVTLTNGEDYEVFYPKNNGWYMDYLEDERVHHYSDVHTSDAMQNGYTEPVVCYMGEFHSLANNGNDGSVIIQIKQSKLAELAHMDKTSLVGYWLFNGNGDILVGDGDLILDYQTIREGKLKRQEFVRKGHTFLVSKQLQDEWILVIELDAKAVFLRIFIPCTLVILSIAAIVASLIFVLRNSIEKMLNPLDELSNAVEKVGKGDFDSSVSIQSGDELELLADVFNKMVIDIKSFTNQSIEHEKLKKQMEIENLMLQINPHFIYNTMNTIIYLAKIAGNNEIAEFAKAFVSLLQNTLVVRDSYYNSVGNEIDSVRNYLLLQTYRYEDAFDYEIDCPEDLYDCRILNVMIQPAVENAIFHGIAPKGEKCFLTVRVRREDNTLCVEVEDDGVGMSQERLQEIMRSEHLQKSSIRKIGIANVKKRIEEIYGVPYTMTITSLEGVGTKVVMSVPIEPYYLDEE